MQKVHVDINHLDTHCQTFWDFGNGCHTLENDTHTHLIKTDIHQILSNFKVNTNNDEYLVRLTRTGPKHLHLLAYQVAVITFAI